MIGALPLLSSWLIGPSRSRIRTGCRPTIPLLRRSSGPIPRPSSAGADTYVDPRSGYTVLTAGYLARRGHCCESGCRHCPYVRVNQP